MLLFRVVRSYFDDNTINYLKQFGLQRFDAGALPQMFSDLLRDCLQFPFGRGLARAGPIEKLAGVIPKRTFIPSPARNNVKMQMWYRLSGSFTLVPCEVESFGTKYARERDSYLFPQREKRVKLSVRKLVKCRGTAQWCNKRMPRCNRNVGREGKC